MVVIMIIEEIKDWDHYKRRMW